jgi:NADH dehydrogenase (ubiquinone) 1 alpha subcomplex subunit 4
VAHRPLTLQVKHDQNLKFLSYNPDFWAKRKEEAAAREKQRLVDAI